MLTVAPVTMAKGTGHQHPIKDRKAFQKALLSWFNAEGKDHPWRRTQDPWAILVSEIMLQQTTVAAVIANRRFEKFLEEFPDLTSIAAAPEEQLLKAWEGLGYYNRVRNLQKAAHTVLEEHNGEFPIDASSLEALPGIGKYTAGAVSSFAFDQAAPIVDGNITRVLARLFSFEEMVDTTSGQKQIWAWAHELLDENQPRLFNSAIMELGQTICSQKKPACLTCPVQSFCLAPAPEEFPKKKPRRAIEKVHEHAILSIQGDDILMAKEGGSRRKGFWRLPLRSPEEVAHLESQSTHQYSITHHRVTVSLYRSHTSPEANEEYLPLATLEELPIASPIRRIINASL